MKKSIAFIVVLAVLAGLVFWFLTQPARLDESVTAQMETGDAARGEMVFWTGGCASCHAAEDAKGDEKLKLGGGHRLPTPAGIFVVPNISPDPDTGIGNWTGAQFANAVMQGVAPDGSHYYPAFPYTSYTRMKPGDVADLWAFMKTLPPVSRVNEANELALPFRLRRGLGLWKAMFMDPSPAATVPGDDPNVLRGQYLVEGPGHCAECHSPRTLFGFGGSDRSLWLAGGPNPEGKGVIPNITPDTTALGSWSEADIAGYLKTGFTPEFDSVGGSMVDVQENMAHLDDADLAAIAAYLKAIPPVPKQ
jgi:mono/diheme cytochrome c family protein